MTRRPPSPPRGVAWLCRRRLFAIALPAALLACLMLSLAAGLWRYGNVKEEIIAQRAALMPGLAASIADPLWSFRYEQVGRVIEGVARDADVLAVTVFDELGHPVSTIGRVPENGPAPLRQIIEKVSSSGTLPPGLEGRAENAGSLVLWPSMARAWQQAERAALFTLLVTLLAAAAVLLAASLALRLAVGRPTAQLLANLRAGQGSVEALPEVWRGLEETREIMQIQQTRQAALREGERALRETMLRFARLYNGSPVLLQSTDQHGCLLGVNDHWVSVTGHARHAVLGRPFASLLTPASARRYREEILPRLIETGRTQEARVQLLRPDGRMLDLALSEALERPTASPPFTLAVLNDLAPQLQAERLLERAAQTDQLTGLLNRMGFMRAASALLAGGLKPGEEALLLQIDCYRFKWINDTHGVAVGDRVLALLGPRLAAAAGPQAIGARLGGDEFAILMPAGPLAERQIERLRAAILEPVEVAGLRLDLEASIGLARYPADGMSVDALLGAADLATQVAKREGRHQLVAFGADHARAQRRRQGLRRLVQSALDRQGIEIHIQPVLREADGRVVGAEVLARLRGPEGEPVPPGEFILAAEESGQIVRLGRLVLERALAALPGLAEASGNPDFYLAVNLSAGQVSEALPEMVAALARAHGIEPRQLVLEITETALFQDEARAEEVLRALAARGFRFALDDFGTGHSSVGYLTRLPVHLVKIERGFTAALAAPETPASRRRSAIVRAVAALARELDLPVVAEGVETEAELSAVRAAGIPLVQGYLYARPMPPAEAEDWLRARGPVQAEP